MVAETSPRDQDLGFSALPPSPSALPAEQLELLLELGLVDLALGETLIKNVEGGATVAVADGRYAA